MCVRACVRLPVLLASAHLARVTSCPVPRDGEGCRVRRKRPGEAPAGDQHSLLSWALLRAAALLNPRVWGHTALAAGVMFAAGRLWDPCGRCQ